MPNPKFRRPAGGPAGALYVQLDGFEEVKLVLTQLPEKIQRTLMRQALRAAARPIIRQIKEALSTISAQSTVGTWVLMENIVAKVIGKPNSPVIKVLIGARRKQWTLTKYGWRLPSRYLHLLENGFLHKATGRFIPGKHFMRNAVSSQQAASMTAFRETFWRGLGRELVKQQGIPKK